ncbi:MAG: beta-lactamase family protein [Defluviitaleaceae bacterium]|nr:beta-lactamase family protein [Defluviitaleaceae bacterium]
MSEPFNLISATPESMGISSKDIECMLDDFEKNGFYMHSFMLLRNGKIAAEGYNKPLRPDTLQRMYSISKTFTAAAVGLLMDEGKITLTDKVYKFFPDKCPPSLHPYIADAQIRDLLMMATPFAQTTYSLEDKDWAWTFFNTKPIRPPGTIFNYDTSGTYILDVIVERVSGMSLMEYLQERMLKYIDFSKDAWCVKAPEGNSWGGSGVLCTTRDLAKFALVFLNRGNLAGRQLISKDFVTAATSMQIDNSSTGHLRRFMYGYGYQIWITRDNSFTFWGMGDQFAICIPDKNMVFVCTADNQGNPGSRELIYESLWSNIVSKAEDSPLPENTNAYTSLNSRLSKLELYAPSGDKHSKTEKEINSTTYEMNENNMGISEIKLDFLKEHGKFTYQTIRGKKEIIFGYGEYKEGLFPETHYFGDTVGIPANRPLRCVASGVWTETHKLVIRLHVIDHCLGNLTISFGFKGEELGVSMHKSAEWFLNEYEGFAGGTRII